MKKAKLVRSVGCYTGLIDVFAVYKKYFIRWETNQGDFMTKSRSKYIFIAEDFDPLQHPRLYSQMDIKTCIRLQQHFDTLEEFESYCKSIQK
jgi:hypothetical protein